MLTKQNIIDILKKEEAYLKSKFCVKKIALFGSFAKGAEFENSDVDLLVEFERSVGFQFIHLSDFLEKKIGGSVDMITSCGLDGIRLKSVVKDIKESLVYV